MTPKEKAVELYEKMYYAIHIHGEINYYDSVVVAVIIAVNEVIDNLSKQSDIDYWKEVKKEVKKL